MSEVQNAVSRIADLTPDRVERLWWFLHILAKCGGRTDAGDHPGNWIAAFCLDFEDDTFNTAARLGFIRVTHDGDLDFSEAKLTVMGTAFATFFQEQPAMSVLAQKEKLERRVSRLERAIRPFGNAPVNPNWGSNASISSFVSLRGLKVKHLVALRRALNARGEK